MVKGTISKTLYRQLPLLFAIFTKIQVSDHQIIFTQIEKVIKKSKSNCKETFSSTDDCVQNIFGKIEKLMKIGKDQKLSRLLLRKF